MMLKGAEPRSKKRCDLLRKCSEMAISYRTRAELTECMLGKTDDEKEELAEKLIEIVLTSKTEEEMVERSRKLI